MHGALAVKRAADSRALALTSTIRKLMADGFVSQRALADELNRRGIPTGLGGTWHRTTIVRMLTRLGLQGHRSRVERAKDTNGTWRQMAPKQR
jgi:hypothetical protein